MTSKERKAPPWQRNRCHPAVHQMVTVGRKHPVGWAFSTGGILRRQSLPADRIVALHTYKNQREHPLLWTRDFQSSAAGPSHSALLLLLDINPCARIGTGDHAAGLSPATQLFSRTLRNGNVAGIGDPMHGICSGLVFFAYILLRTFCSHGGVIAPTADLTARRSRKGQRSRAFSDTAAVLTAPELPLADPSCP